jgi:sugar/nucleoside kinase (ribokinase family)
MSSTSPNNGSGAGPDQFAGVGPEHVSGASPEPSAAGGSVQRSDPPPGAATVCLGEALVDFICERPLDDVALGDAFVPHFGGSVANVSVIAARHGARVTLASGAGDDAWGRWLRHRLGQEGVGVSLFELTPGAPTPVSLVAVNAGGEPSYQIYGDTIATVVEALGGRLEAALERAAGLYFSSNTMVGSNERDVTMRARAAALELGRPIVFDPNLRLARWRSRAEATAAANACVPGALLVRANAEEVSVMTGEGDLERAALALLKAGARMVVVTLGSEGAILRGELRLDVPGRPAAVRSTIGAGDVLTGVLLARLANSGYYPSAVAAALPEAVVQSSLACERWGALE